MVTTADVDELYEDFVACKTEEKGRKRVAWRRAQALLPRVKRVVPHGDPWELQPETILTGRACEDYVSDHGWRKARLI